VVLWEGTVARAAAGTRLLSVRQFVLTLADSLTDAPHKAALGPRAATAMSLVIGVGAVLYAIRRLRRFEVGETG
jgi:ABC-2 type transport system permease protein